MKQSIAISRLLILLLLLFSISCNSNESNKHRRKYSNSGNTEGEYANSDSIPPPPPEWCMSVERKQEKIMGANIYDARWSNPSLKIKKEAILVFDCTDWKESKKLVDTILKKYKGYYSKEVIDHDSYSDYYELNASLPAENLEKFMNEVENSIKTLQNKTISKEDVTTSYIDQETRLNTKKKYLQKYQDLLAKAKSVEDITTIQEKIEELEEEIESSGREFEYLQHSINYSSIYIKLFRHNDNEYQANKKPPFFSRFPDSIKHGLNSLVDLLFWLISIWHIILIIVVIYLILKRIIKNRRMKKQVAG